MLWFGKVILLLTGEFSSIVEKGALSLQKCIKCNRRFGWSKILKSYKWGADYGPLECDNCGTTYKMTIFGRCTMAFQGVILPALIVHFFLIPTEHTFLIVGVSVLMVVVGFLLSPYVVRYKEKL